MRSADTSTLRLGRRALDHPAFSAERREALFAAVLIDDRVDPDTALPPAIHLDYEQAQLTECYRLCRQVWTHGVDRITLGRMIARMAHERTVPPEDRVAFKHVRAKFKHLRFARAAFDERHRYPSLFNRMTRLMGQLQDAFKHGQDRIVRRKARRLGLWLTRWAFALVAREVDNFRPSRPSSFRAYVLDQIATIRIDLAKPAITGKEFHQLRKIVSRQVAQYDSLRTLYPSTYHDGISRYLSATNGLMGAMHDDLIEKRVLGTMDYHRDPFPLPDDIRVRLAAFADKFPAC